MIAEVVDTNVLVAANARDTHVRLECALACIDALTAIQQDKLIVIDDRWRIIGEYQRNAFSSGQPGPGDAFLLWLLRNQANPTRCEQVTITPHETDGEDFEEFPRDRELETFDRSDRKFVAVARASRQGPVVLNATDTDWHHHREPLARHGIRVTFLCPEAMPHVS